jgi:hypothetical protein
MIRAIIHTGIPRRRRPLLFAVLTTLLAAGCRSDSVSPVALSDSPDASAVGATLTAPILAAYVGIPYGPFFLWTMNKVNWGPKPFTGSQAFTNADTLILQINAARSKGQRLVIAMTGGPSTRYTTNGQFSMTKWKSTMNTFNKSTLKAAVAAAVTDGTLIGNSLIDEPETKQWGTILTKPMIDQMAAYSKTVFPTLPVGVNHGPPGYKWRATERYTKVDYVAYQYAYWVTKGNVITWRTAVLAQAKLDGVTPALSVNILNGGAQDQGDGLYDCKGTGQAGLGTRYPNCRMTSDQLRTWGTALLPYGCIMFMWKYDAAYMNKLSNQDAFKALATLAASKPRRSCKRV